AFGNPRENSSRSLLLAGDSVKEIRTLQFLPNGQLLAAGTFTWLNGIETHGVARLNLSGTDFGTSLANLSIRTRAGTNDETLIAGFVVGGTTGQAGILARGVGPALAD